MTSFLASFAAVLLLATADPSGNSDTPAAPQPIPPQLQAPEQAPLSDAEKAAVGKALTDQIIDKSNVRTLFESLEYNDKRLAAQHIPSGVICPFQAGETNDISIDGDTVVCHSTLRTFGVDLAVTIRPLVGKAKAARKDALHRFWDRQGNATFVPTIKAGWPVFKKNELSFVQAGDTLYVKGLDGRLHRISVIVVNNWVIEFEASGNWNDAAGVALLCDIDWMDMVYGAAKKAYDDKQAQTGQPAPQPPS